MQHDADACFVIDRLIRRLTGCARERWVWQAVLGSRFRAIMLDDGATGAANLYPEGCGKPLRYVSDPLPQPGSSAADVLVALAPPLRLNDAAVEFLLAIGDNHEAAGPALAGCAPQCRAGDSVLRTTEQE